ncbi:MAG: hypothetical protein PUB18_00520 [bacterium]|nr:hypothetical protein [bacterium]
MINKIKCTAFIALLGFCSIRFEKEISDSESKVICIKEELVTDYNPILSDVEEDAYQVYYDRDATTLYFEAYRYNENGITSLQYSDMNNKIVDYTDVVSTLYIRDPYHTFDFTKILLPEDEIIDLIIDHSGSSFSLDGLSDHYYNIRIISTRINSETSLDFLKFSDLRDCSISISSNVLEDDNDLYNNMQFLTTLAESGIEIEVLKVGFTNTDQVMKFLSFVSNVRARFVDILDYCPDSVLEYAIETGDFTTMFHLEVADLSSLKLDQPVVSNFSIMGENLETFCFSGCDNLEIQRKFLDHEEKKFTYHIELAKKTECSKQLVK